MSVTVAPIPDSPVSQSPPGTRSIYVYRWVDPVVDRQGFHARSQYVEAFWLSSLGPTATLLLRHLSEVIEHNSEGVNIEISSCARRLGVSESEARNSTFRRSLSRLVQFGLARQSGMSVAVRLYVPLISRRQLLRLTPQLREAHTAMTIGSEVPQTLNGRRERCRRVAGALAQLGDSPAAIEQQLANWGFHPSLIGDVSRWLQTSTH